MNLLPQFGFFELIMVAVIALVVVGPKDLPRLMRAAGRMAAQARRMAGEFAAAFDQMAREAEMEEMRKEIESLKRDNVFAEAKRAVDEAARPVEEAVREEAGELRDATRRPISPAPAVAADGTGADEETDAAPARNGAAS
ncbi:Sec-independent protein translocase protein TatB [Amphiplicatus metriothermophilus]|uniref:Sec-independent protein translocase protein TatB n=1 Tax=Amphiplicatus metriothermophilus TaxID=1519374 RepID=A0A239PUV3_9PROT|nr:Sec-independent protein translocase protein TatB [Amphiplicatus metriothermophilus]MBB5519483.1 sec-independent protein translocase protein TatB [Amphiplicatus metriothermophilus]SNT73712.1 sec-independent protein translocase protein TatB [Amphiplicatus metriothermophilus]